MQRTLFSPQQQETLIIKSPTPNTYDLEGSGWSDENRGSSSDHIDPRGNIVCAVVATTGGGRCSIKQRERAKQEMEN